MDLPHITELPLGPVLQDPAPTARVVLLGEDCADAWYEVMPRPKGTQGRWIGVDGPRPIPPDDDEPAALLTDSIRWGSYGKGLARGVVVGRLGELAVDRWFRGRGHVTARLFKDPYQHAAADLLIDEAMPTHQHPRYAPPWFSADEAKSAMAARGKPLRRLHADLAVLRSWSAVHGTTGPVVVEEIIRRSAIRDGVEVWPPGSREVFDPVRGTRQHVRHLIKQPPHVSFDDLAVEVKTWSRSTWPRFGRHINADQLLRIVDKAEVVIWCRVAEELPSLEPGKLPPSSLTVELTGWNSVRDLVDFGEPVWVTPVRAQLHVPTAHMRPMDELTPTVQLELPTWPRRTAPRLHRTSTCGHRTIADLCWACAWHITFDTHPSSPDRVSNLVTVSDGKARFYHHPDRDRVTEVHGRWPFTAPTRLQSVADVCLYQPSCPGCFPT